MKSFPKRLSLQLAVARATYGAIMTLCLLTARLTAVPQSVMFSAAAMSLAPAHIGDSAFRPITITLDPRLDWTSTPPALSSTFPGLEVRPAGAPDSPTFVNVNPVRARVRANFSTPTTGSPAPAMVNAPVNANAHAGVVKIVLATGSGC